MSDYIRQTGTFTVTINGSISKFDGDCTLSVVKTGSNAIADVKNIGSASAWTPLNTSSLSDLRYAYFANEGTGTLWIASNSTGTNIISKLDVNDHATIPWSGSIGTIPLYANCPAAGAGSVLYYILAEA
jgi:hypothetical protein